MPALTGADQHSARHHLTARRHAGPLFFIPVRICCCILLPLLLEPSPAAPAELIGPFGGSAAVIQVDPLDYGAVMVATSNGLLFRSRNGGDSWVRIPFPAE